MKNLFLIAGLFVSFLTFANEEFDKGVTFANRNQLDSAIASFNKVLDAEPRNATAFYNLGYCFFQQKKYGEAIWAFEKTIQFEPKNSNALKNLEICHFKLDLPSYTPINSSLVRSLFAFGSTNWSITGIICSIFIALSIITLVKRQKIASKRISLIAIFFFLCLGIMSMIIASFANTSFNNPNAAIVVSKTIPTYLTVSGEKSPITLPEGTRIIDLVPINNKYTQGLLLNGQEVMIDSENWKKL